MAGPAESKPVKSRPATTEPEPVESRPDVPGTKLVKSQSATRDNIEYEPSHKEPLPGLNPESSHVDESRTHWVDTALNMNQATRSRCQA